jgi:hypothetical protein
MEGDVSAEIIENPGDPGWMYTLMRKENPTNDEILFHWLQIAAASSTPTLHPPGQLDRSKPESNSILIYFSHVK